MGIEEDRMEGFRALFDPIEERQKYAFHLFELFESIPDLSDDQYSELLELIATDAGDPGRILSAFLSAGIGAGKPVDQSRLPGPETAHGWKAAAVKRLLLDQPGPASSPHRNDFHVAAGSFGLLFGFGYPDLGEWVLERSAKLHARYLKENDLSERRLDQTWFLAIGHFSISILFLAAAEHRLISSRRVQNGRLGRNGNEYLFQLAARTFSNAFLEYDKNFNALPFGKYAMEQVEDRLYMVSDVVETIDRHADPDGTGILALDDPTRARMKAWIAEQGQDPTKPIVTLHVRTDGFRSKVPSGMRSWNIRTLFSSIRLLVEQGYLVVRLGDPSMPRIAEFEGFIDYAHSKTRAPDLDIAFVAEAAFHIGSSSGMSLVPILFGTPCLMLNWYMRIHAGAWGRRCWTVFKKITDLQTGEPVRDFDRLRVLGLAEYPFVLERHGAKLENLSEEEILRAVERFMADRVSDREADVTRLPGPRNFIFDSAGEMLECDIYGVPGGVARGGSHKPEGYSIAELEAG